MSSYSFKIEIDIKKLEQLFSHFKISHLLLIILALHMLQIPFPVDGKIFDEAHYVPASEATLKGIPANAEHPPLPKIIGAIGIALLGDNWFGWRFPQVLFHLGAIYLIFLIAKRFMGERLALVSASLYSLDIVTFIHGGALLLDASSIFFMLLAVELYFRKRWLSSAFFFGISFISREMGALYFISLIGYHIIENRSKIFSLTQLKASLKNGTMKKALAFLLVVALVTLMGYWAYDVTYKPATGTIQNVIIGKVVVMNGTIPINTVTTTQTKTIPTGIMDNPISNIQFILNYQIIGGGVIRINETYQPWHIARNWILPIEPFKAPIYFSLVRSIGDKVTALIEYTSIGTLPIWYSIWFVMPILIMTMIQHKDKASFGWLILLLFWANYTPYLILDIITQTHRIGFNYYFIYSIPALVLGIPYAILHLPVSNDVKKLIIGIFLVTCTIFFLLYFPVKALSY